MIAKYVINLTESRTCDRGKRLDSNPTAGYLLLIAYIEVGVCNCEVLG